MAIQQVTKYVTTEGTECASLAEAQDLENAEQILDCVNSFISWRDEEFDGARFLTFLKRDAHAVAFVDALLDVYSLNPHTLKESKNELAT